MPIRTIGGFTGHSDELTSVAFNHNSNLIATTSKDRTAQLWPLSSNGDPPWQDIHELGHTGYVTFVAFNHNGTLLATASGDKTAKLWQLSSNRCRWHCIDTLMHMDCVMSVAFNHNGTLLATASLDRTAKLWQLSSDHSHYIHTLTGHTDWVYSVAFNHNGTLLATASGDNTAKLWQISSNGEGHCQCIQTLTGHAGAVVLVTFNHKSTLLASASKDCTSKLWQLSPDGDGHWQCIHTLTGHTDWVRSVAFNHNATLLATASEDNTVKLWQLSTDGHGHWQCIHTLTGHTGGVVSAAFNHNGTLLATASNDKTAKVWDLSAVISSTQLESRPSDVAVAPTNGASLPPTAPLLQQDTRSPSPTATNAPTHNSHLRPVASVSPSSGYLPDAQEHLRTVSNTVSQSQEEICSLVRALRPGVQDAPQVENDDPEARILQLCNDRNKGAAALIAAVRTLDEMRTELMSALNSTFRLPAATSIGDIEYLLSQRLAEAHKDFDKYDDLLKQQHEKEDAEEAQLVRLNALKRRLQRRARLATAESAELRRLEADNRAIEGELIQLQAKVDEVHRNAVQSARELQRSFPEMLLRIPVEDDVVPTGSPSEGDVMYRRGSVTVYKANVDGKTRCIKRQDIPTDEKGLMRLRREVDVLRELRGPGVLPLLYSKEHDNCQYIVTPYYELGSLADLLFNSALYPQVDAFVVNKCLELLSGLHRIHSSEVVHGDLKPDNIFVSAAKEFVIGDFGAAKTTNATTTTSMTRLYAPPEYVTAGLGFHTTTPGDIFSMGLVLEELAVCFLGESVGVTEGQRPFAGFSDAPPLPLQGHADLKGEWLKHMLKVMLQSDPTRRWAAVELLTHQFLAPGEDGERGRNFTNAVRAVVQGNGEARLEVHRRHQQEDTNSLLSQCYGIAIDAPLRVVFAGETGIDATGLTKELYSHLLRDLGSSGLLVTGCSGGAVLHVGCDRDVKAVAGGFQSLELLGVLLLRFAIAYGSPKFPAFQCPNVLSRYLLRFLLEWPSIGTAATAVLSPTAGEFAEFDHDSASRYADVQKHPARAREYDLTLNDGSMVTALTVSRLVEERRRDSMHDSRQRSLQAVRAGFQRNHELLLAVREWVGGAEQQLQIKLCLGNITSEDVVRELHFDSSLQANSRIATLLKEYLRSCDKSSLLRFLYFVTGGYALVPIRVFLRQHDPTAAWPLPSVATCFNHLKLYSYPDLETLTERLHYAMEVSVTIEG